MVRYLFPHSEPYGDSDPSDVKSESMAGLHGGTTVNNDHAFMSEYCGMGGGT